MDGSGRTAVITIVSQKEACTPPQRPLATAVLTRGKDRSQSLIGGLDGLSDES